MIQLAGAMRNKGADEATIVAALETFNATHCSPPKKMAELYEIAKYVCSKPTGPSRHINGSNGKPHVSDTAEEDAREASAIHAEQIGNMADATDAIPPPSDENAPLHRRQHINTDDPRPEIVLSTDQPAIVDKAINALAQLGGVYVRGRQLVHVVRDHGAPDWWKRPDGAPVIVPIERDHLLDLLGRAARWTALKANVPHDASPPAWVAARIMARGQWKLPQLESIADSPVFRADGSICDVPGYDPATRVIYDPGRAVFQAIPQAPTQADAQRALADLVEPFNEFPFIAESDRMATAALILSTIGRAAIEGNVPMFPVSATAPGSGKGLLVEVVSVIATGRKPPLMSPTDEEEETRKRLLAIAIESPTMVVIDNIEHALGSASLAMALTAGVVTDRQLGVTKMVTASLRPVWAATGQNVQLKGDLGRRVAPIDLDPKCEHPEDRKFNREEPLIDYVQANRPRLVVAALTVLRAFFVAKKPAIPKAWPPKGSFEPWSNLVRGAIAYAGGADPLGGVKRIREQGDDDLDKLRTLLTAWHEQYGGTEATVSKAIKDAGGSGDLHDALAAYCRSGRPESKPIGHALHKVRGRVVNDRAFERGRDDRNGVAMWKVVSVVRTDPSAGNAGNAGNAPRQPESEDGSL